MMLPQMGKLYDKLGRELKTLYDTKGNVIWQSAPTVIWQGYWSTYPVNYNPMIIGFDKSKFSRIILQFQETIVKIEMSPTGSGLALDSGRAVIPLGLITSNSYLYLYKKGYENNPNTFKIFTSDTGITMSMFGPDQPTVTLTTIYAE